MLRNFFDAPYVPILSVRPGEMRALEELPNNTKDLLFPMMLLRPWVGSHRLENAIDRIAAAYSQRPIIVGVGDQEPYQARQVFDELEELRSPSNGFRNWCRFVRDHENFVPIAQLFSRDISQEDIQIEQLLSFGRGVVLHIPVGAFGGLGALVARINLIAGDGNEVLFVLDFGSVTNDHLQIGLLALGLISTIRTSCPLASIAVSATSFPSDFTNNPAQQLIFERRLFQALIGQQAFRIIYSDRGSARIDRPGGGGGQPYPRIDYPMAEDWRFFRDSMQSQFAGYQRQAILLANSPVWNPAIRVWGTQMIERTINGDRSAISDPRKATAARINLHLHVQTFFNDPSAAEDTDEEWEG